MSDNPKVFISYSHQDTEYEDKVLNFANKLRSEGIDANIDLYEEAPPEGWPRWMENQIEEADFVLVINSKSYYDKFHSDNTGKGISWEVNIFYQQIYDSNAENTKFIPVYFDENDVQYILTPIKPFTHYNIGTIDGYEKLYRRLRGIAPTDKPPLGKLRPLPEKEQKTMFVSTPIDLEKWNAAGWKGMLYLFAPKQIPILGMLYKNYSVAKSIFSEWKQNAENSYADKFLEVSYIVPPFPKNCWIYSDAEHSFGKGYFVHIGPNINESFNRAIQSGLLPEEIILTSISRYQWMDEANGSRYRDLFKRCIENGSEYLLMPIAIKDETKPIEEKNLIIDFNYAIMMKNANFELGVNIEDDDIRKVVLSKPEE